MVSPKETIKEFSDQTRYIVIAAQRCLKILKLFTLDRSSLTLSEISQLSGLSKSTVLRLLYTLTSENFLKYSKITKKYQPGIELFKLGYIVSEAMDIRQIAHPYIEKAVEATGLVAHIGILEESNVVIIEKLTPKMHYESISMVSRIGGIVPVHCTGVGKVMLAFKEPKEVESLLKGFVFTRYSENTITSLEELQKNLAEIRALGYGMNDGEHEAYIKCYTFPVFDQEKKVIAAISLTGLRERMNINNGKEIIDLLRTTTLAISRELGYPK